MPTILATDRLTRRFGQLVAVDELTLSVDEGEVFGLLVRNGAVKSTLIKMLTTLLPSSSGKATIAGLDIAADAPAVRDRRLRAAGAVRRRRAHRPRLLFLDGPTVGLDPVAREVAWERLERLRASYGTTLVLTSHYMDEVERLCGRIAVLRRGRKVAMGTEAELRAAMGRSDASLDEIFAHYTGDPSEDAAGHAQTATTRHATHRLG